MENIYPRLQQLRAELEGSATSPEHGLSVLYAIRRELLRHYHEMPFAQLLICPPELRDQFYKNQLALQQAPAFPAPSASAQFASTVQALSVLEQVATCRRKQEQLLA
ncbi:hypothetical protein J0X19_10915 [Hymenobacter sp. BT186]|uniref:Uncharacterized protein n=1 Tax=Hymenobacter telluris TaxID=2816474 RepID=A0A939EWF8_9BACT|nr:hypothetical protein [Hymenobacter telluris]MBO0358457.1 hypothetical protein [Hymenobacter telluris]MBW3374483.1 hypothetical protein [Hymenobacter norwichensis]